MAVRASAVAVMVALGLASSAGAQVLYSESPRTAAVRLHLGSYNPRQSIDSEPGLTTRPYEDTFGRSGLLLFEVAYEHYVWQGFGAVGGGLSAGYAEKYGKATALGDPTQPTVEPTALQIFPLRLFALYNFDYLALQWGVPLAPYVRGGLAYVPWRITKSGKVEVFEGRRGAGGKWGLAGAAGLAFLLDVLEPRFARDFDTEVGVNHSYLFAEYNVLRTDLFGGGGLNLSSHQWMFGLALEF